MQMIVIAPTPNHACVDHGSKQILPANHNSHQSRQTNAGDFLTKPGKPPWSCLFSKETAQKRLRSSQSL